MNESKERDDHVNAAFNAIEFYEEGFGGEDVAQPSRGSSSTPPTSEAERSPSSLAISTALASAVSHPASVALAAACGSAHVTVSADEIAYIRGGRTDGAACTADSDAPRKASKQSASMPRRARPGTAWRRHPPHPGGG